MPYPHDAIVYSVSPQVSNAQMNKLFASAWDGFTESDFGKMLAHSLAYVCAYSDLQLVGYVNLAWDGGIHAFLLDTTVHRDWQRQGIGRHLVEVATERGIHWLHVDYEPHLEQFYKECGFLDTHAGLRWLREGH
ncbi:MAG: GNAT family N-acetyltransferase [Chloroflexia bacterium]